MSGLGVSPPPKSELSQATQHIWKRWFYNISIRLAPGPFQIPSYAKADLPAATKWYSASGYTGVVMVQDEVGGATLAYSDGTNWRRVQDRAIVA